MTISRNAWLKYIGRMSKLSKEAASEMGRWVQKYGFSNEKALITYAYSLATKYGEGSAELACEMYEAIAEMSGVAIPYVEPAGTATYAEVAKAVRGAMLQSPTGQLVEQVVDRLVKQAGADTIRNNAIRDGAQWAWIPSGTSCAFCLTLGSRGWQYASKKTLKGDHADHIHANCDCQFMVRFNDRTNFPGYDPEELQEMYYSADGSKPADKINSIRRMQYASRKDQINEQKREAYMIRTAGSIIAAITK